MANNVYLGLGSNLGNKIENLQNAVKQINLNDKIKIISYSSLYETSAVGYVDQDNFFNLVLKIITYFSPLELLKEGKKIELQMGRKKNFHWGPRIIDIDILLYDDFIINEEDFIVPHKELTKRDFVLEGLIEIDENLSYPVSKLKLKKYLTKIKTRSILNKSKFELSF